METTWITTQCSGVEIWRFAKVKDLVLNRTLVLYRWLPFVLYFPIIVYSSLCFGTIGTVGSVSNTKLLGSSLHIDLENGRSLCEHAGWQTEDGYKFLDVWKTGQTLHGWSSNPVWWFSSEIIVHLDQIFHCPVWFLEGTKKLVSFFFLNKWDFTSSKQWDMRDVKNIWFSITRYDL